MLLVIWIFKCVVLLPQQTVTGSCCILTLCRFNNFVASGHNKLWQHLALKVSYIKKQSEGIYSFEVNRGNMMFSRTPNIPAIWCCCCCCCCHRYYITIDLFTTHLCVTNWVKLKTSQVFYQKKIFFLSAKTKKFSKCKLFMILCSLIFSFCIF